MAKEASKSLDHDLLIAVNTKLERVIADIKELKDNVAQRVSSLESDKFDKDEALRLYKEHEDAHKTINDRIDSLEELKYRALGALVIIQLILGFIMTIAIRYFGN